MRNILLQKYQVFQTNNSEGLRNHQKMKFLFRKNLLKAFLSLTFLFATLLLPHHSFAQITQRGSSTTAANQNSTTLTINKPTGVVAGDVLIVNIAQNETSNQNLSNASLAGWTLIDGRLIYDNGNNNTDNQWWGTILYRVADGTEGTSFIFALDADADMAIGSIVAFYNVDITNGPFDVAPGFINVTNGGTVTATAITTSTNNAAVIMLAHLSDNRTYSNWTTTSPGALVELFDNTTSNQDDASVGAAWAIKAVAGSTGPGTATLSANARSGALLIALKLLPTIVGGAISPSTFCVGSNVSVPYTITGTYTSGNVFTAQLSDGSGSFASPVNIGTLTSTTNGTISATIPTGTLAGTGYRIRVVSSTPAITGTDNGSNLTVNSIPSAPATTGSTICIGSSATLSASGAVAGDRYKWYNAAAGGTLLKTSTNNTDNTYTTPTLASTTNYWVSIINAGGCESSRTQVTATFPAISGDNQNAAGSNTWIGHVYDGTNQAVAFNGSFTSYYGSFTEPELFDQNFGASQTCFGFLSNSEARSIYTETYSVRYRMNSTKRGLYIADMGSDDGGRLAVDGLLIYNNWSDQSFGSRPRVLMSLNGASSLVYDFYENGGENRVVFQNLVKVLSNTLNSNTTQNICLGNTGSAISGDVYGTFPTGITISGTGYQWAYSTISAAGPWTDISGATAATYTPSSVAAPFNAAGTYYFIRKAVLSSTNNVSPNPYLATNVSNAATLTVNQIFPASVSIASNQSGAICAGISVTFTATPTNGGTTPVYQWKLNGLNAGTNNPVYTNSALANNDVVSCLMTSSAPCASGNPATSNAITITVNPSSTGGTISGGASPLCLGEGTGTMTLTGYNGTILRWERQINSGGWANNWNAGNNTLSETPWSAGTWEYRVVVQAGSCPIAYSTVKSITISANTVAGWMSGSSETICEGSSTGIITLNGSTGSIVRWEKRLGSGAWTNISNTLATFSETPISSGTWEYRVLVQSGSCPSAYSGSFTMMVNPTLSITLGPNPTICVGTNSAQLTYTATTGNPGQYNLDFDATANSAGLGDITGWELTPGQISVNVPWNIAPGVYNGILAVTTSYPQCSSIGYPITITVSGTPLAGLITGNTTVIIGSSQTYSVAIISGATFAWTFPAGWTQTAGGTSNSITVTVGSTSGNVQVIPSDACGTGVAQTLAVTVTSTYCAAASLQPELYESITNVTFAGINNSSPVVKTDGYTDYTGTVTPGIAISNLSYPISISERFLNQEFGGYCKVFIDYDHDGTFDSSTETAFEATYAGSMTMSGNITIPIGATLGLTRMRIVVQGDGTAQNTLPCGTFLYGEVEDYLINIEVITTPSIFIIPGELNFGYTANGSTSDELTYSLAGINLSPASGSLTVNAPANFEISLTTGTGFGSTLNVPYSGSTLTSTTIYVRFKPTVINTNYFSDITNEGGGAATQNVIVAGTSILYCSSSGNTQYQTSITFVDFNTISNPSGKPSGYSNYYTSQSTDVAHNSTYNLTVNVNTDGNYLIHAFAWIDWNQDGDFSDPGEEFDLGQVTNTSNGPTDLCPLSITIPATAAYGYTRMRISARYNANPTACLTNFDGEVEDYSIHVLTPYLYKYRSIASGNWSTISNWEFSADNGFVWSAATVPPAVTDGTITIRIPDVITANSLVTVDELTIESGGTLVLAANMDIADGVNEDIVVNGALDCNSHFLIGSGSFTLNSGGTLKLGSAEGITLSGLTGNIQTNTRNFTSGANYTFIGVVAQVTGNGMPATVNDLTVNNSAGLTLESDLTINGILGLSNGTFSVGSKTLTFQNSDTPVVRISGTLTTDENTSLVFGTAGNTGGAAFALPSGMFTTAPVLNNLTINRDNDLTLNNQMLMVKSVLLCTNGTLNTSNNLTLLSSPTQTALIDGAGNGEVLGNVTMQRYLSNGFGYKYVSSPFQDATVGGFSGEIDLLAAFPTFYRYDENRDATGWVTYVDPSGALLPMKGYTANSGKLTNPKTLHLTGIVSNGVLGPLQIFNHKKLFTKGYNLLGNPYPSPIDWDAANGWVKTNIDDAIYFFNAGDTSQYNGVYSTYINGMSSDGVASNLIPSMQGFFVHVSDGAETVTGTIGMDNRVRINDLSPVYHKSVQEETRPLIRLNAVFEGDGAKSDPLVIYFDYAATALFEKELEALKLNNTDVTVPNFYAISEDSRRLSIGAFPYPEGLSEIPLGLKTEKAGNITFSLGMAANIPAGLGIYLKDKASGKVQNMGLLPDYTIQTGPGAQDGRLSVIFSNTDISQEAFGSSSFNAFVRDGYLYVNIQLRDEQVNVQLTNMAGQIMLQRTVIGEGDHRIGQAPVPGIYLVTIFTDMGTISKKIYLQ